MRLSKTIEEWKEIAEKILLVSQYPRYLEMAIKDILTLNEEVKHQQSSMIPISDDGQYVFIDGSGCCRIDFDHVIDNAALNAAEALEAEAKRLYNQSGRLGVEIVGWSVETDEVKATWLAKAALDAIKAKP